MSIKQFKVMEMVGKGSFASVYKVIRRSDSKAYALKRVKMNKMSKKEISDALNEVRFLASIRHPNIVAFYEAFFEQSEAELCVIMEFCGCGDLAQKIERYKRRRQYMNEDVIWMYLIQVLKALQLLHGRGICHRDLKAANTFLAEDGSIKIGDMNVSKQLKYGPLNTQIGTPYYMSPEIWSNRPYDEKCDIWSLGCMIYELASLRPPFLGDSFPALKRCILSGRYPALPRVYSEPLSRVIGTMLRLQAKDRPNAQDLLSASDIMVKICLLDKQGLRSDHENAENHAPYNVLRTIKVPQVLSRLNDVLPKACYPSAVPPIPSENNSAAVMVKGPPPPLPSMDNPPLPPPPTQHAPAHKPVIVTHQRQKYLLHPSNQAPNQAEDCVRAEDAKEVHGVPQSNAPQAIPTFQHKAPSDGPAINRAPHRMLYQHQHRYR